jgi:GAF domain-containing protein
MTDTDMTGGSEAAALRGQLEREVALRRRLVDLARRLSSTLHHDELIGMILAAAAELLGAETASLLLVDEATGDLQISFASGGIADRLEQHRVPKGQGIAGWVVDNHATAVVNRPEDDERFYGGVDDQTGFETINMLAVPLLTADRTVGVLEVINRPDGFDDDAAEVGEAFASLAAIALENAGTYAKLAEAIVTARMSYRV